ncbi:hypothetical protein RU639_002472 [Aspergillus parasiticus]|uniref:beta-glucosidase n=1 Tax=Aspergillus transmontanensis TaxID=1034304 RepID=A0A5N6VI01_9EURO|nr:fibronectin type III-like domain-containing protein [Aspergillus transmontanensis]
MAKVHVQVANTSTRAAPTVVQVYVSFPLDVVEDGDLIEVPADDKEERVTFVPNKERVEFPDRVLRNLTKIALEPGEKKTVEMTLSRKDLSYWRTCQQNWVMPDGDFQIWVGQSSRDLPLCGKY